MNFYPATTHAYNAGYDDGFFVHARKIVSIFTSEQESYDLGYLDGVKHRPKPKAEKAKKARQS